MFARLAARRLAQEDQRELRRRANDAEMAAIHTTGASLTARASGPR